MSVPGLLERVLYALMVISLGLTVAGTKACRENYVVGAQSNVPSPTPTGDDDDDDDGTATRTPTPDPGLDPTETPEPDPTDFPDDDIPADPTETPDAGIDGSGLLRSLSELSSDEPAASDAKPQNWLGQIGDDAAWLDGDGDGYSDAFEIENGTDPNDPASFPSLSSTTRLSQRFDGVDDDVDGVPNVREELEGTNPNNSDTDGDGASDGAELLAGTDPTDPESKPDDDDGDGLSAEVEAKYGTDPENSDTDGDRLRDDTEIAIGTDPRRADTDGDGISDGREVELGSDPLVPEGSRQ